MENSMEVPCPPRLKIQLLSDPAIPLLGMYAKEFKAGSRRYLHIHVHHSQEVEAIQTSINRWMDKEELNRWRNISCSWIGRLNIIKMAIVSKVIYRLNAIFIKIPTAFFTDVKAMWIWKGLWIAKTILKTKNKVGEVILPDFKTYLKAIVIKTRWYWHSIDIQINRKELRVQK